MNKSHVRLVPYPQSSLMCISCELIIKSHVLAPSHAHNQVSWAAHVSS